MPTPAVLLNIRDLSLARRASAPNASESASLHGHKAKTPIIAGSVCGSLLFLAWTTGLIYYLIRRRRKKLRAIQVAAGILPPKPVPQPPEKYIIPPDPAVVFGQRQPGEHVIVETKHKPGKELKPSKTTPDLKEPKERRSGSSELSPGPDKLLPG